MKSIVKLETKREIVRRYIKNNPNCTYLDIKRNTKIKIERIYKNMPEAYKDAGIKLSKNLTKRNKDNQKRDVINFIKNNPNCSVIEIHKGTRVNIVRVFGTVMNAYKAADVLYPERQITSGVRNPLVVKKSNKFERKIINLLRGLGEVIPKVKTKEGIADCIFKFNNRNFVVEVKDYRGKNNITMYEIKQLIRYMKALNCNDGLLICPKESFPKRKNTRHICVGAQNMNILSKAEIFPYNIKALK